ncbi:MAG TPA: hypothetical protein DDW52_02040 [Planctomycetaceae bacterium]|nr:hypothetical protein [Planctomycetaceae bacterium]
MTEKPIRPVIEDDVMNTPSQPARPGESPSPLLRNLFILLGLVLVAVIGFAGAAGWLDDEADPPKNTVSAPDSFAQLETPEPSATTAALGPDDKLSDATDAVRIPPLSPIIPTDGLAMVEECKGVVEHLTTSLPSSVEAREVQARFEFEFGQVDEAEKIWKTILDEQPNFVFAMRGLGDVCTMKGRLEEAVRYFRRAVIFEPDNLSRQLTLGTAMLQAGKLAEAREVLQTVIEKSPRLSAAHTELGRVESQLQNTETAVEHFRTAIELDAEDSQAHLGLATALAKLGKRDEARTYQQRHIELRSEQRAELEEGRRTYDDAVAMGVDIANVYVNSARVYLAGGLTPAAELLLLRAARMSPGNIDCRQALSFLAGQKGQAYEAIRWMKEVAELAPAEFNYSEEVARLYLGIGQPDAAEKTLTDFVERNPDQPFALRSVANFFLEATNKPEKAIALAEQATAIDDSASGHAALAATYEKCGRIEDAAREMEKAAELAPENTVYKQTAALLRESIEASPEENPEEDSQDKAPE